MYAIRSYYVVGEIGAMYVHNMPSQNQLRLEVPGTYVGGNRIHTIAGVQPATEPASNFADEMSWGYQIRARLTYNNAIGPVALIPDLAFAHDFSGNSPGPRITSYNVCYTKLLRYDPSAAFGISWAL